MKTNADVAEVTGRFENFRNFFSTFLIFIFLIFPWLQWNNQPLLLLDIWNRHFIIFGRHFFSHDAPLLFFILITLVFGIILVTAIWGRVWCGWACPQTVFIASIYRKLEKYVMGSYAERLKRETEDLNKSKIFRISVLWAIFILLSYLISHSFMAYFVGAEKIVQFIKEGPQNHFVLFLALQVMTGFLAFNFGFFREKFCHHLCPYGRFQNVLLDTNSLGVIYMKHAGEPRKAKDVPKEEQGACVDCGRCVRVCPMKIDIRNGFQLECINCAACIDACDEIMEKVNQPTGLIQFSSADGKPIQYFRFRVGLYAMIIVVSLVLLAVQLYRYGAIELELNRARQNAFIVENKGVQKLVTNHFEGSIKNQKNENLEVLIRLDEPSSSSGFELMGQSLKVVLAPLENRNIHLFVRKTLDMSDKLNEFQIEFSTIDGTVHKKFKLLGGS